VYKSTRYLGSHVAIVICIVKNHGVFPIHSYRTVNTVLILITYVPGTVSTRIEGAFVNITVLE
jgi:hypothetical protein